MLGLDVLRAIAAAACFDSALMQSKNLGAASIDDLRKHCIAAAVAAECVARVYDRALAPVAFMCGLLHDLGIIVMLGLDVENEVSGQTPHGEDGDGPTHEYCAALTFEVWGLPDTLVIAAKFHHHPENAPESGRAIASIVHLGDTLAESAGFSFALDAGPTTTSKRAAMQTLGLSNEQLNEISEGLVERVEQLAKALAS
jgi:HD-like signal output (HDOD) protein